MLVLLAALAGAQDLAIRAEVVHPVVGEPIEDGVVIVRDGVIAEVGAGLEIPEGMAVVEGAVATPGLIDALSQVGLTGVFNNSGTDQDHREQERIHPDLRAIDAYNPWEPLVGWLRGHGVTTARIGPSPGGLIAGRTAVVQLVDGAPDQVALATDGPIVFTLGDWAKRGDGPKSRMGAAAEIRQALTEARDYAERQELPLADRPPTDLGMAALAQALDGEREVIVVAHRADDLLTALRIREEFGLEMTLSGATEGYLVRDQLAAARVAVLVGPVMVRNFGLDSEVANASFENAALLAEAGVPIAFTGGFEGYVPKVRVVLWEAAIAAANRLGPERALEALTYAPAAFLGISDRLGSLEVGKQADIVVFDGEPFETTSHVCTVIVNGRVVSDTCQ